MSVSMSGSMLEELGTGVGWFKGGLYGFAGSGKTHTSTKFALGIRKALGLKGRIAFFDTETGVEYVAPMIREDMGQNPVGKKSRSLGDAIKFLQECEKAGTDQVAVAIVDSVTHIWDEVQKSYLNQLNEARGRKGLNPRTRLEWQDRGPVNDIWQKFTDTYLNSSLHIIICGRAANLWQMETNEDGKKELNKIGTKMKTQSEMGYEPSFLAEMEREQRYEDGKQIVVRTMTVLKDRFRILDGKAFDQPTFDTIAPHVNCLKPGAVNTVDTTTETNVGVTDQGDAEWYTERKARAILCEEVQGLITQHFPGQSADEKRIKVDLIDKAFKTRSWTAVENMDSGKVRIGLELLPALIAQAEQDRASGKKDNQDKPAAKGRTKKSSDNTNKESI